MTSTNDPGTRALLGLLGRRVTQPSGGSNPNRLEPGTVTKYAGFPSRVAMVSGDQPGATSDDDFPAVNVTGVPLSVGSRVMVQFYEPRGVVIVGVERTPMIGFIGTVSESVVDGGTDPSAINLTATYDSDGFLTGVGHVTIPSGRDGLYSISLVTNGPVTTFSRIFNQFVIGGPTPPVVPNYRSAGGAEVDQAVGHTLRLVSGSTIDFQIFQQSGSDQVLASHVELLLIADNLAGI